MSGVLVGIAVGLLATGAWAEEAEAVDAGDVASVESPPAADAVEPVDAGVVASAEAVAPAAEVDAGLPATRLESRIDASLRLSQTGISRFPLDDKNTSAPLSGFETRIRVAPEIHFKGFGVVVELDAASGTVVGGADPTKLAARVPAPPVTAVELRQAYFEYRWATGAARLGQQVSQFGLGMLSGSGAKDAEAGDFGQSHFGTLAWRALVAGRPLFGLGGAWRALEPVLAADLVVRDSTAEFFNGDRAFQGILGLRFNVDADHLISLIGIYRHQRPESGLGGEKSTDVVVIDLSAKWIFYEKLKLGFELAGIVGDTTQGRTPEAPVQQVRQFGAFAKGSYRVGKTSVLLDLGYASGDSNPYDDQLNSFRFDRDLHVGLVLFEQVLAYQSARAGFRASDPQLSGVPPEGVDLLPTGGGITGAAFVFPRVKHSFFEWLDLYGGPLVAFSTAKLVDPYSTRVLGGGVPLNFLGRRPGDYLGTELDVGLQGRFRPWSMVAAEGTLEGGLLIPGNAFAQSPGGTMGPVWLVRLRLSLKLD